MIVFSAASLTTTPCITRLGIALLLRGLGGLATALAEDRLDPGDVAPHAPHLHGILELAARLLETQVEGLLAQADELLLELVRALRPEILRDRHGSMLLAEAGDEPGADRQLGRGERHRLDGHLARDAVHLEHDPSRMDAAAPELGRALAGAHAHLGRLLRDRHVGEDADPHAPHALDVARDRAPRRLDLARGDAARLDRLEPVGAEIERRSARGQALDAALVLLAV